MDPIVRQKRQELRLHSSTRADLLQRHTSSHHPKDECDVSSVKLSIPTSTSGTPLATPLSSLWGALAELFDISCLPPSSFDGLTTSALAAWEAAPASTTPQDIIDTLAGIGSPEVLGQHYFITNPSGTGLSPKWDFTSASFAGNSNAFVIGARTGDIPAPTDPAVNIDWLSLSNAGGDLADQVFRVQTRGGQPPTSCTPGSPEIFVRYTSQYWFFGGSL
ncbi:hypothetical protein BC629DRAFT_1486464 [Irpex lacteus]|nr:hypothetical protein BC629DRAFT_1486464 [Irpex lacteus]